MNKQQAKELIKKTFENPFDKERFTNFVKNLLNRIDEDSFTYQGQFIPDSYKPFISKYIRVGKFNDGENRIDILIVYLNKNTSIERARTMQRNFIAGYLQGNYGSTNEKNAALVAFVSLDKADWRFSLVKLDYLFKQRKDGIPKAVEEFTPARRWSFLVGANENSHTAQSRLVSILANDEQDPTLKEIEKAFDIETVTKEFFLKYRELFLHTKEELDKVIKKDPKIKADFEAKGVDTVNFAKKLLGQIIFLYFLQKKGWLGVGKDDKGDFKSWETGPKNFLRQIHEKKYIRYSNFFNDVLEPLFYEALATERPGDYYSRFNCKIPFLNGGLFEPIGEYNWQETDILINNDLFSEIFKTFDQYNFTVREDEPLEKEVAVDPEMLGKVFENLLPGNLRKGQGAYYTPREIVHYMCQESLINHLDTSVNTEEISLIQEKPTQEKLFGIPEPKQLGLKTTGYKTVIPRKDIEDFIRKGEFAIEHDTAKEGGTKSYRYQVSESIRKNARLLDEKLKTIKICDPAIGSGAFPVGMMHEIVKARNVLTTYLEETESRSIYNFKRRCIQQSLYGVDIDPGAIDIAKLRLWLSLIVDEDDYHNIKPLPNLDYKIMQGNSLIEEFHGISLNLEKENKSEKPVNMQLFKVNKDLDKLIENLHNKQGRLFLATHPEEKRLLKREVEDAVVEIFHYELQRSNEEYFRELRAVEDKVKIIPKKDKKEYYDKEKAKLDKRYKFDFTAVENELREMTRGNRVRNFFPWKLYFADVFRKNGGFDVVIANPPYIRQESIRNLKPLLQKAGYEVYNSTSDIYTYFYEKSYQILKPEGFSTFITSNKWMRAKYGENLRKFFKNKTTLLNMIDFGGYKVFEATVDTNILIFKKETPTSDHILNAVNIETDFTNDIELDVYSKKHHLSIVQKEIDSKCFSFADDAIMRLKAKIEAKGTPLKDWDVKIYRGILTGFNKAFIIDTATKERLTRKDLKSAEIIKPILRGRDIGKYYYEWAGLWIIAIPSGWTNKNKGKEKPEVFFKKCFPAIYEYLKDIGDKVGTEEIKAKGKGLYQRDDQGNYWWELRDCDYYPEFNNEKIIYSDIGKRLSFVYEPSGRFLNNTGYFINNGNKYLLAFLNSLALNFYYGQISSQLGNAAFRAFTIYIEQLPIPNIPEAEQKPFITLVDQILSLKKSNPQTDTSALEDEIDRMVYDLYGLTAEEIAIVKESVGR